MGGGAWPFLVGGAICLVNSDNERDSSLLNSSLIVFVSVIFLEGQVEFSHTRLSNNNIYVEIYEIYYFHWKYHRSRRRQGSWVVGILERGTGRCWLEPVRCRDAPTLEPPTLERIISDHVLPVSTVVTDAWGSYINVQWTIVFTSIKPSFMLITSWIQFMQISTPRT